MHYARPSASITSPSSSRHSCTAISTQTITATSPSPPHIQPSCSIHCSSSFHTLIRHSVHSMLHASSHRRHSVTSTLQREALERCTSCLALTHINDAPSCLALTHINDAPSCLALTHINDAQIHTRGMSNASLSRKPTQASAHASWKGTVEPGVSIHGFVASEPNVWRRAKLSPDPAQMPNRLCQIKESQRKTPREVAVRAD